MLESLLTPWFDLQRLLLAASWTRWDIGDCTVDTADSASHSLILALLPMSGVTAGSVFTGKTGTINISPTGLEGIIEKKPQST